MCHVCVVGIEHVFKRKEHHEHGTNPDNRPSNFPTSHQRLTEPLGRLVASPLGIGWIDLDDGSRVQGFRQAAF